jgi:subtilisin family serine protease
LAALSIAATGLAAQIRVAPVAAATPAAEPSAKLRADLAALVAGAGQLDPRLARLVPGLGAGQLPYFVVAGDGRASSARAADLEARGAHVMRAYRSVPAFAVRSDALGVLRVAALPWVERLAPVELVFALDDEPVTTDPERSTAGDLGADDLWADGLTGTGVRIAVLDTGLDPAHPDLDDLDFRRWSAPLNPPKVVEARDFTGGACRPALGDGNGHGTHVAGIATGTGEGTPTADDDAGHAGIAPDAELAVGKVLTDAGAGLNSDLIAALEWAAMPAEGPTGCAVGADIVNLSLGSEARPDRLNSGADLDLVSETLNVLAVRYGTLFVAAIGNSGPFIGSALESPGSAAQALSVGAAAKDWDVNHDDTESGDTCAGWRHPPAGTAADNSCLNGPGDQPPSLAAFSSRGPSGDLWLRPDVAAPGYNIVAPQSSTGTTLAPNDLNQNTRTDPLYANASGTSMASPATAGAAALVLQGYRARHGSDPTGGPVHALLRAALMNTAGGDLYESRWIFSPGVGFLPTCPPEADLFFGLCSALGPAINEVLTTTTTYQVRNGAGDPFVGLLGEGAGKIRPAAALAALRDGVVVFSAATGDGIGPREHQGSWQVGRVAAGSVAGQRLVVRSAPDSPDRTVSFSFVAGNPSDGGASIDPAGWSVSVPAPVTVGGGRLAEVELTLQVPDDAAPGVHTGVVLAAVSGGDVLRIPAFASVELRPGIVASGHDVYAKHDTIWPSAAGQPGTGSGADWLAYPVDLPDGVAGATFLAWDSDRATDTYDLYLYDADLDLVASSHPFAAPETTDVETHRSRAPSTESAPTVLTVRTPAGGPHTLVVSRARVGPIGPQQSGTFGSFGLLFELTNDGPLAGTTLDYDGDRILVAGSPARLSATLIGDDGRPVAGRTIGFAATGGTLTCGGIACAAVTDYHGMAQIATDPVTLTAGLDEIRASFSGDRFWSPSKAVVPILVVGAAPPTAPTGGRISGAGWIGDGGSGKAHFAFDAASTTGLLPSGDLRWRDASAGVDVRLVAATSLAVVDDQATLRGNARDESGGELTFELTVWDRGHPDRNGDAVRFRLVELGYVREGVLGGGNVRIER